MKKYIKYLIAFCFLGIFLLMFFPFLEISIYKISVFDVIKFLLDIDSNNFFGYALQQIINQYLKSYVVFVVILFIHPLINSLLTLFLKNKIVYKNAIINIALFDLVVIFCGIICLQKFNETSSTFSFFDTSNFISFSYLSVIIMFLLSIVIICLSILELKRYSKIKIEETQNLQIITPPVFISPNLEEKTDLFTGAIIGTGDIYNGYVFSLEDRIQVFFEKKNKQIDVVKNMLYAVASIYYIKEYEEYCIKPLESRTIYLSSGQPLGKGKYYYLPRSTDIYIEEEVHSFKLG